MSVRDQVRRTVGRYEIVREVGRGATAVVYLARQTDLDRNVALKELAAFRAGDPKLVERYVERSGRDVGPLAWFEGLALWKAAVFCEAIYGRFTRGELGAEDARAAAFETAVPLMAETAAARLESG